MMKRAKESMMKRAKSALRRRYGHSGASKEARRVSSLQKKASKQESQASKTAVRRTAIEHRIALAQQRCSGSELKLQRQLAALRIKEGDLLNAASSNRALAAMLQRRAA
jgi:hypothetical protein